MKRGLLYIKFNEDKTSDLEVVRAMYPERRFTSGTEPSMASIKASWDPEDQWRYKQDRYTKVQRKEVIARVVEIALVALFTNFCYKFGSEYFHQSEGGPIGVRLTGCAAECVMQEWSEEYQDILERSGVWVALLSEYVDDGRQITTTLEKGTRYCDNTKKFTVNEEAKREDEARQKAGESKNQRTARVCKVAMDSVNPDLHFTTECQEDYEKERLPTLDFEMWLEKGRVVNHSYFQKNQKNPLVIMAKSAMSQQQKLQILANDLTRRIYNINKEGVALSEYREVIEVFTQEMCNSGYCVKQACEAVVSGVRGWRSRLRRRERAGQEVYRPAVATVTIRGRKRLMGRETWYKPGEDEAKQENSPTKFSKGETGGSPGQDQTRMSMEWTRTL